MTNQTLGVNDKILENASITVSPNPTSGLVTVNGIADVKTITVFNVAGELVLCANNTTSVNLSNQAKGVCFVKVTTENGCKINLFTFYISKETVPFYETVSLYF